MRMDPLSDPRQPLRSVIDTIESGHVREQRLRGTDIRCRLLASDVLFARLNRHAVSRIATGVHRDASDSSRLLPDVPLQRGEKRCVRTAVAKRDTEAL